jgi:hypothetical protein
MLPGTTSQGIAMPPTRIRTTRFSTRLPRHTSLTAFAIAVAGLFTAGAGLAHAGGEGGRPGALGQATGAVREHQAARGSGGGGGDPTPGTPDHGHFYGGYDGYVCPTCAPVMGGTVGAPHAHGPIEPMEISLSLGLQSVVDSDAALSAAARVRLGGLAFEVEGAEYWERARTAGGPDTIYMDIWSIRAAGRVLRLGRSELWIDGGLCGTGSNVFERVTGTVIGAGLLHAVRRDISLRGGARYYVFDEDLTATEARADLAVSFLSVGYRVLELGAGPALHGPGVGVHATF